MIVEADPRDYASLLQGRAPHPFALADTDIASPEILQMLADVAAVIRRGFSPASWLIVEDGEMVGLCSLTRAPQGGTLDIGYGIAPSRQGRGFASRAVGDLVAWAAAHPRVRALTADTSPANTASQCVLERNGFARVGERVDDDDGLVMCWRRDFDRGKTAK
jgi:RimJ/RimL family protein N-acetyltransferase